MRGGRLRPRRTKTTAWCVCAAESCRGDSLGSQTRVEVLVWSAAAKYDRNVFSVPHAAIQSVRPHAQQSPSPSSLTPALFQETQLRALMRGQPALATLSHDLVLKFDPLLRVSVL